LPGSAGYQAVVHHAQSQENGNIKLEKTQQPENRNLWCHYSNFQDFPLASANSICIEVSSEIQFGKLRAMRAI
jgi:hypothetical protein